MIASEKRVSLFGNNVDLDQDAYLNENTRVLKLTNPSHFNSKKKVDDEEIGIFGAEKYFKGAMDEQVLRTPPPSMKHVNYHQHPKTLKESEEDASNPKAGSTTPSVHSEASCNSRSGLLVSDRSRTNRAPSKKEKTSAVKNLFISLGCNCIDSKSVKITESKVPVKEIIKPPVTVKSTFTGGFTDESRKDDCFSFPVMNMNMNTNTNTRALFKTEGRKEEEPEIIHVRTRRNSLEGFGSPILEKGKKSFSLERKLTMLNWDGVTPKAENMDINIDDAGSDASSDLFEIESLSTNGNNSFLARQVSNGRSSNATDLPNGYAPSEASIAWSVVTASVTGFSIVSDYDDAKISKNHNMERVIKGTSGILSGCNTHKSVRVSGEHVVMNGVTKQMSSFNRGHSSHASHHLYIQQQ